ncbi:MAG: tRNA 2-thiocytidine(32) synthetase TtcA [Myxococcota bacterium]
MSTLDKITKRLYGRTKRACLDHALIAPGDHILVCLSGGKDSYTMLEMLLALKSRVPFELHLTAFHLDQAQPGYPAGVLDAWLQERGVPHVVLREDTYSVVQDKLAPEATPCSLCSRLRRGIIYTQAAKLGCNKIALGHHRDDSVETLLLNMVFSGQLQGMPAVYTTDDGAFQVIRPLVYCAEDEITEYASLMHFPIIPCTLCGSVASKRQWAKHLLDTIEQVQPTARATILSSMQRVRTTHLLDRELQERLAHSDEQPDVSAQDEDILRLVTNRPAPSS